MSKIEYKIYNKDEVVVEGDMGYYIKYVEKIFYPEYVKIIEDWEGKYLEIRTTRMTNEDEYEIFVVFDTSGNFEYGVSTFFLSGYNKIEDEFQFKKKIKKEINMINNIHGATKSLINLMDGDFARSSYFRK